MRLEDLVGQKGVHQSRNSHVARVLRELGYMRELGEGMRRIYDLMHRNELAPPTLQSNSDGFTITLTHRPLYSDKDLLWLSQFDPFNLDREQKAVVLLGEGGRIFSPQQVWDAVGIVDTEHYRKLVDALMKQKILISSDRVKAQKQARAKRIPFREFPRYEIEVPPQVASSKGLVPASKNAPAILGPEDVPDMSNRLFIGNLPRKISKEALFDFFAQYGDVAELYLAMDGGNCKAFGFVEFAKPDGARAAFAANGVALEGRKLVVRRATVRKVA